MASIKIGAGIGFGSGLLLLVMVAGPGLSTEPDASWRRKASDEPEKLPESRSFHMAFTPWPYDFSPGAQDYTYRTIVRHADMLLHHLDSGVPWPEALAGKLYHPKMIANLRVRKSHARSTGKLYVSATPQSQDRASLAGYWGAEEHQPRTGGWANKNFDDPDVIEAYIKYCEFLIDFFSPDYFAYGIEVNGGLRLDHPNFEPFRKLCSEVYTSLKKEHPDLPVFLTFQTGSFEATWEQQWEVNRALVEYSDMVGMSTYPMWAPGHFQPTSADMSYLPKQWFAQMAEIAPEKPFAITETGYIAEKLELASINLSIDGTDEWQARYVDFLLTEANRLKAEFVVWFVLRDYDQGWEVLERAGLPDAFKIWRDTGLFDGEGRPRKGLELWDRWLKLPRR